MSVSDWLLGKSDDDRARGGSEKGDVGFDGNSGTERESDDFDRSSKEILFHEKTVNLNSSSSSRTDNREVLIDSDRSRRGETMGSRSDQSGKVEFYDDNYRRPVRVPVDNWVRGNNNSPEFVGFGVTNELVDTRRPFGLRRSMPVMDQWSVERNGAVAFHGNARRVTEHGRFATFPYPDEGPSNYPLYSFYGYDGQRRNTDGLDGLTTVENLENDRAELLRKLDEMKDQLSRTCDTIEKPKERVDGDRRMASPSPPPPPPPPLDPRGRRNTFTPEGFTSLYNVNLRHPARDKFVPKPPYFSHNPGPFPYAKNYAFDAQDFYPPPRNFPYDFLGYEDAYRPQILRRPPHQYLSRTCHDHFPGQYMDLNQDPLASHPHETFFHQPACSCLHCYNKNWQIPPKVPPPVFDSRRLPNEPTYPLFYHHVNPATYDPPGYNCRHSEPHQLNYRDQQPQIRSSSDLDSDSGGFGHHRPRRVVVAQESRKVCHPIAGGAPFITCRNCFELLKLPRKLMVIWKNQQKMRCGACSAIILFEVENNGLVVLVPGPAQIERVSVEVGDGSGETLNTNLQTSSGCLNSGVTNSCSDNYDNSDCNFQLTETESNLSSRDQRLTFSEAERRQEPHIFSSSFTEDEQSPNSVVRRVVPNSAELLSEDNLSLRLPDSPLQECPGYSSSDNVMSRYGKGNESKRTDHVKVVVDWTTSRQNSEKDVPREIEMEVSINDYLDSGISQNSAEVIKDEDHCKINESKRTDHEKVVVDWTTSRQNSVKHVPGEIEMEVSINDYLDSGISQDSAEVIKDEDRCKINLGSESLFPGLIKKSFLSRSTQSVENGRSHVFVNGQLIPERVVKKAEKLAGPIRPGEYWYDFQAGFWGVMGHPCLGVIPPFIEQFNYPMPENCGAGNTGVFVNGRELHQRDLDLLASRGLPITREKSYIIKISGRVLDGNTGEDLYSLGKLAPTVEKAKHGFGMKVPRAIAR